MSSDVIIVPRDVGKRAESLISSGGANVTKGVELLLVENVYVEGNGSSAGPNQVDCSAAYKRGIKILQETPFDVLGVDLGCQTVDVRKAYKKLALKYHPDKNPKTTPLFQVIQSAVSKLSVTEDRQKEEQQAQAKKKTANHPTPSSFAPKPTPVPQANPYSAYTNNAYGGAAKPQQPSQPTSSYNTPRTNAAPAGNAYGYPGGYGAGSNNSYQYSAQNGSYNYGGAANKQNAFANPNNPYAQANAQRQQQQQQQAQQSQQQQNQYNQYANYKHDEARRKNYYEELLKEQYRKAAESDQRAREFAAKRASEQKTEFDSYAKRAQQQYQQYQQENKGNSDPPLNGFRPGPTAATNNTAAPNNPGTNYPYKQQQQQPPTSNNGNGGSSSAAPSSSSYAYPSSQSSVNSNGSKNSADQGMPYGIGKTYKATADGRVYPQQSYSGQQSAQHSAQASPRPNDTASVNANNKQQPTNAGADATKQPSFSNKKVVPKPFAFKTNSIASSVVELEWKTSVLHHCNLGVELSWKEKKSSIWEVSEKMIRSGCCRKKNLNAGSVYEFRIRAVEDLPNNLVGNKSEWSEVITVALLAPADSSAAQNKGARSVPPQPSQQVPPVSARHQTSSEPTPRYPTEKEKDKRPAPPSEIPKPPPAQTTDGNQKFQPAAPTAKSDAIPQKFRRFNSKMKEGGHQMEVDHDKRHGDYGDIPRPDPPSKAPPTQSTTEPPPRNQFSASKVLSASAREAWGKETQKPNPIQENEQQKEKQPKGKRDVDNLGDDVHYVEVEGEGEIDEEDEVLLQSKGQSEWSHEEDEISEDEALRSSEKAKKAQNINPRRSVVSDSPKPSSEFDESDSVSSFDKKLEKLDREYEKEKENGGKNANHKKTPAQPRPSAAARNGKKDASPFAIESDEDEEDNYEDDFAVEEEIHYQLVAPLLSDSKTRKRATGKSKKNIMEVLDDSGTSHAYLHPVHAEPFVRSEIRGYLTGDKTVIACATCGDWVRVKIHIMKDKNDDKKQSLTKQASSLDIWGWCMKKDKEHDFLQRGGKGASGSNHNSPLGNVSRSESQSSVSSLPSIAIPKSKKTTNSSSSASAIKGKESHHPNEYRTPLKKKTLSSKNSLGNTSLFNLNKPTPKTANKKASDDHQKRKKQGDIEHFDLEDSFEEESSVSQWMECYDDQGNIYYYNDKTKEFSWDAPEWIEEIDPTTGAKYYCHFVYNGEEVSMTSTWTRPKHFSRVIRHVTDV